MSLNESMPVSSLHSPQNVPPPMLVPTGKWGWGVWGWVWVWVWVGG